MIPRNKAQSQTVDIVEVLLSYKNPDKTCRNVEIRGIWTTAY